MTDNLAAWGDATFSEEGLSDLSNEAFNMRNPRVEQFLEDVAGDRIGGINETTRDYVRKLLADGYADGLSIGDIENQLDEAFAFGEARSELIARTEVLRASNFGSVEAYRQSGVIEKKEWIATPGTKGSRDGEDGSADHEALDGQVVNLDAMWTEPVYGDELDHPGDGPPRQCCNCRCAVAAVVPDPEDDSGETAARDVVTKAKRETHHARVSARRSKWEAAAQAAVTRAFDKQKRAVLKALRS